MDKFMRRVYPEAITFNKTEPTTNWTASNNSYWTNAKETSAFQDKYIKQSSLARFKPNDYEAYPLNISYIGYNSYSATTFELLSSDSDLIFSMNPIQLNTNYDSVWNIKSTNTKFGQKGALYMDASAIYYGMIAVNRDQSLWCYDNVFSFSYGFYMKITKEQYDIILNHDEFYVPCGIEIQDTMHMYNSITTYDNINMSYGAHEPGQGYFFINFCSSNKNKNSACVKICNGRLIVKEIEYDITPDEWMHFMITKDYSPDDYDTFRLYINGHLYLHWNENIIEEAFDTYSKNNIEFTYNGCKTYSEYLDKYATKNIVSSKKGSSFTYYYNPNMYNPNVYYPRYGGILIPLTSYPYLTSTNKYYYNFAINGEKDAVKFISDSNSPGYYPVSCYIDDIFFSNDIITTEENFELPNRPFIEEYPEGVMSPTVFNFLEKQKEWTGRIVSVEGDPEAYPLIPNDDNL